MSEDIAQFLHGNRLMKLFLAYAGLALIGTCVASLVGCATLSPINPWASAKSSPNEVVIGFRYNTGNRPAQVWVAHPDHNWRTDKLNLKRADYALCDIGDVDGDDRNEVVVGLSTSQSTIGVYDWDGDAWIRSREIAQKNLKVSRIRDLVLGDLDQDGKDEIIIGTRPSGLVIKYALAGNEFTHEVLDADAYGNKTTWVREVEIGDADNDGRLEVLSSPTRQDPAIEWDTNIGSITMYKPFNGKWLKSEIARYEDTHAREHLVADIDGDGKNEVVVSVAGVIHPEDKRLKPPPMIYLYRLTDKGVQQETVAMVPGAIKARACAAGNLGRPSLNELVCGDRGREVSGLGHLNLLSYDPIQKTWASETLDTTDGLIGFHAVTIGDIDSDGVNEIIASDDDRGELNVYKRNNQHWQKTTVLEFAGSVWVDSLIIGNADNE